ncbi:unnamed protein product [Trichobilharzia regenti]|nr:unnamed protein product [Trichobilharzia regenti]
MRILYHIDLKSFNKPFKNAWSLRKRSRNASRTLGRTSFDFGDIEMHDIGSDSEQMSSNCDNTPKSRRRKLTDAVSFRNLIFC